MMSLTSSSSKSATMIMALMMAYAAIVGVVVVEAGSGSIRGLDKGVDDGRDLIALYSDLNLDDPKERPLQAREECTETDQIELIRMTGSTNFPNDPENGIEIVSVETSETKDVAQGLFDTITITCNYLTPVAYLEICVADSFKNDVLVTEDDAQIPDCCHPENDPDSGAVCYVFEIGCIPKCDTEPPTLPPFEDAKTEAPVETKAPVTRSPTVSPTAAPTKATAAPTKATGSPTVSPTAAPTKATAAPTTMAPTTNPTASPTDAPTKNPTASPTDAPTTNPTASPTAAPTTNPTASPTDAPTMSPTVSPTAAPTNEPTAAPTDPKEPVDPGTFCHALKVQSGCNLNGPGSCQIDPGPNGEPSCGAGVPVGYHPDLTNCNAYCWCSGTAAPSRYEIVNTGLEWDNMAGSASYLPGKWGKNGAWGTTGGNPGRDTDMSLEGRKRPPQCGPKQTCPAGSYQSQPWNKCKQWYTCVNGNAGPVRDCGDQQLFDKKLQICNWESSVKCNI